jgi:8-oxo-dGTP pyrophosphatase MutT (NUDIX family)
VAELAAGAIVVQEPGHEVLLLHHRVEDRWCFAKGHVDPGESLAVAALREIHEEAGLGEVRLGPEIAEVSYRFFRPDRGWNVHKTTVYFLGWTRETKLRLEATFDRAEWLGLDEARRRVPFETDRSVLDAARPRLAEPQRAGSSR